VPTPITPTVHVIIRLIVLSVRQFRRGVRLVAFDPLLALFASSFIRGDHRRIGELSPVPNSTNTHRADAIVTKEASKPDSDRRLKQKI
jgi:hypothetical protein